jgi:hypothetical protein
METSCRTAEQGQGRTKPWRRHQNEVCLMSVEKKYQLPIEFMPINGNVDERELKTLFAQYDNAFLNSLNHIQTAPGKEGINISGMQTGEDIVNIYYWKGVQRFVGVSDQGRLYFLMPMYESSYAAVLLADFAAILDNQVYRSSIVYGPATNKHLIKTKKDGLLFTCFNYMSGTDGYLVKISEADGVISLNVWLFPANYRECDCICAYNYGNTNKMFMSFNGHVYEFDPDIMGGTWSSIYDHSATCTLHNFIVSPDSNEYLVYLIGKPGAAAPTIYKLDVNTGTMTQKDTVEGTAASDQVYSCDLVPHPDGDDSFIMYMGLKNNIVSYFADFPGDVGDPHTIGTIENFENTYSGAQCSLVKRTCDNTIVIAISQQTNELDLWEGTISVDVATSPDTFSTAWQYLGRIPANSQAKDVYKETINNVVYYYAGTTTGIFVKRGSLDFSLINFRCSGSSFNQTFCMVTGVEHSDSRKGILFFNTNFFAQYIYAAYPGQGVAVEEFDFEYDPTDIQIEETPKLKISPTDPAEDPMEFLVLLTGHKLVYIKLDGTISWIRYYWNSNTSTWDTGSPIEPIQSIAYSNNCIIAALQGTVEFIWSRYAEILHFEQINYASAEETPAPIERVIACNNCVYFFSIQDVEEWAFTPNTNQALLFNKVRVIRRGCLAPASVCVIDGAIAWLDTYRDFVVYYNGGFQILLSPFVKEFFGIDNIQNMIVTEGVVENLHFVFMYIPDESKMLAYDVKRANFFEWPAFAFTAAAYNHRTGKLLAIDSGSLVEISQDYTDDDGSPFTMTVTTGWITHKRNELKRCWSTSFRVVCDIKSVALGGPEYLQVQYRKKTTDSFSTARSIALNDTGETLYKLPRFGVYDKIQWKFTYTGTNGLKIMEILESFDLLERSRR